MLVGQNAGSLSPTVASSYKKKKYENEFKFVINQVRLLLKV
jgi:hypothetical protein